MVTLYSGTPGSGKSLHLIELILRVLGWGRYVICNFPIKFSDKEVKKGYDKRFFFYPMEEITVNSLLEFAIDNEFFEKKKESQCLVIIDEAGGRFNTRDYSNKDRSEWIDFFSQHRKCGYDFILVAQQDRMIDRQIRGFIETEKKHRKANNYSIFSFLPFPVFVAVEYWYVAKQKVGADFFLYRKKYGDRYDSMKMFEGFKLSPELLKKIEERKKKKQLEEEVFKKVGLPNGGYNTPISAIFKEETDE